MDFIVERPIFVRETTSNCYNVFPYFASKMITEIPILYFLPLIECFIIFWAIGFREGALGEFALVFILTA